MEYAQVTPWACSCQRHTRWPQVSRQLNITCFFNISKKKCTVFTSPDDISLKFILELFLLFVIIFSHELFENDWITRKPTHWLFYPMVGSLHPFFPTRGWSWFFSQHLTLAGSRGIWMFDFSSECSENIFRDCFCSSRCRLKDKHSAGKQMYFGYTACQKPVTGNDSLGSLCSHFLDSSNLKLRLSYRQTIK